MYMLSATVLGCLLVDQSSLVTQLEARPAASPNPLGDQERTTTCDEIATVVVGTTNRDRASDFVQRSLGRLLKR